MLAVWVRRVSSFADASVGVLVRSRFTLAFRPMDAKKPPPGDLALLGVDGILRDEEVELAPPKDLD